MKNVYELLHKRFIKIDLDTDEDVCNTKRLGFFSSREKCYEAIKFYLTQPGFKDYPDEFVIKFIEADVDDYNDVPGCFGATVFYLSHEWYDGEYDYVTDLGYYSSRKNAEEAKTRYLCEEYYKEHSEGFCIDNYEINKRNWTEGFFTC